MSLKIWKKRISLRKKPWPPRIIIKPLRSTFLRLPYEVVLLELPAEWIHYAEMHEKYM